MTRVKTDAFIPDAAASLDASTSTQARTQPKWWMWLVGAAVILLVVSAILRVLTPYQSPIPISATPRPNLDNSVTIFKSVVFVGPEPTLPQTLSVGDVSSANEALISVRDQLISDYKLTPAKVDNLWTSDEAYLQKEQTTEAYTFGFTERVLTRSQLADRPVLTQEKLSEGGQIFLEKLLGDEYGLKAIENQITTFDGEEGGYEKPASDEFSLIPYSIVVDGYPVFFQSTNSLPFYVTVSQAGQIVKVDIRPQLVRVSQMQSVATITLKQALVQIQGGVATIINAGKETVGPLNMSSLNQVELSSLTIEYRVDEGTRKLLPYYRLSGTALNTSQEKITLEIITPAVPTVAK